MCDSQFWSVFQTGLAASLDMSTGNWATKHRLQVEFMNTYDEDINDNDDMIHVYIHQNHMNNYQSTVHQYIMIMMITMIVSVFFQTPS